MRKILISVLVCLMLIGTAFFMVNGMAKIKVEGFKGIDEKNTQIDNKIGELSNVISVTYEGSNSNLKKTANTLIDSKTEYENQSALSSLNSSSYASRLEGYDIDYLWTRLGNYAKEEAVIIKIDVTAGGVSSNLYNLNFSVRGSYVGATNFIYDIENDSKLGFKIDNFKMTADINAVVTATFTCQDIPLNVGNLEKADSNKEGENTTNQNTNTNSNKANTTNTTSNNTTSNTTSNTNTTSVDTTMPDPNASNLTAINDVIKTKNN